MKTLKTIVEQTAQRRGECSRIAFVHVYILNRRGKMLRDVRTVLVDNDRNVTIRRRGTAIFPGTFRVVLGLGRFLVSVPFEIEKAIEHQKELVEAITNQLAGNQQLQRYAGSSGTGGKKLGGNGRFRIEVGGDARLLLLKRDPRETMIDVRDVAGLLIKGIYYSEMQLKGWVDV